MRRIISWLSLQKIVLFLIFGVVIYQSRLGSSQWLLGWDSVVPELDWKLNFTRVLAGAWQEYQGVGLTGGMAHLADLSRMAMLWMINLVVPNQYVRWAWHMAMLALGPMGVWYLGKKLWKWSESACLVASVFYLLNLATVQYFFVPYEAFSSFYGFLPWLIAVFLAYLDSGMKKDLRSVVLVGIVATSAFYVQTLFVVYVMVIGVLSLAYLKNWKKVLLGFSTVFLVNSFWLLPIIYGVIHGGGQVGLAKINSIGSPETTLMNTSFGNWQNVSLLKGYWLEYIEWIGGSQWGRLMQSWWEWSRNEPVMWVGQGLFGISVVGSVWGVVRRKMRWGWLGGLLLTYIMMASFSAPFGVIYQYLVDKIPLFGEMFRSVFTKWSVVLALFVSIGLGSILASVKNKWVAGVIACLMVVGSIGVVWQVYKTGMIFDNMKVTLPSEYSKMFELMKSQPKDGRVAYLPAQDMWSWKYTDWGYRGSGFLWYGIEQPILDRAFDVWSPYNEGFYNEFSNALYGGESDWVKSVLDKYDVRYVLLDESVIAPGQDKEILRIEETKSLASELGWKQVFQEGFLTVWDRGEKASTFVSAPENYTWVEGGVDKVRRDVVWEGVGTYVSDNPKTQSIGESDNSESRILYPFEGLMREETKGIEYRGNGITISSDHSLMQGSELWVPGWRVGDIVRINYGDGAALPAYTVNGQDGPKFLGQEKPEEGKSYIVARVSEGEEWGEYLQDASFQILDSRIDIMIDGEAEIYDFSKQGQGTIGNCDVLKRGRAEKSQLTGSLPVSPTDRLNILADSQDFVSGRDPGEQGTSYVADERGAVCDYIVMSELDTRLSYLMRMQGENKEGRSLKYFLYNTGSKRNDIEYLLGKGKFDQTFGLLPWTWDGHYTLNIETRSFGQYAENRVKPVEVRWVPLEQIARARIESQSSDHSPKIAQQSELEIRTVRKYGTWLYIVETKNGGLLKLSQGYDEGWVSPYLEHVKVEGWANGWMVPAGEHRIVIFYWPQLLEYLGFGLLGVTIIVLWRQKR